jgi:ketosteroid isomerase-like protein
MGAQTTVAVGEVLDVYRLPTKTATSAPQWLAAQRAVAVSRRAERLALAASRAVDRPGPSAYRVPVAEARLGRRARLEHTTDVRLRRRTEMSTRAILDHQMEAFGAGSADEIIKDFADDAVLIRPEAVFKGRTAIHGVYSEMFAGLFKPDTYEFEMVAEHVEGEYAYIAWRASNASSIVVMGTDTFVVRDGKIIAQSYCARIDPK